MSLRETLEKLYHLVYYSHPHYIKSLTPEQRGELKAVMEGVVKSIEKDKGMCRMNTTPTHVPRGFMCIGCKHVHRKCNHLDFTKMQVIGIFKDDGTKEVKCTDYVEKEKQNG